MNGLLADINIQRQVEILKIILLSPAWADLWNSLNLSVLTFRDVALAGSASDAVVWRLCQERQLVLVTANRNKDGDDSLEATLRNENHSQCLPVFTIADPEEIRHSKAYAERVVSRALEYLLEIDNVRGTGRLYLP